MNILYFTQYEYEHSLHKKITQTQLKFCRSSIHLGWTNRNPQFIFGKTECEMLTFMWDMGQTNVHDQPIF